jgi:DNA invertase Pin-like site-specific DNA recombinase
MSAERKAPVRCAVYTRKSSEEGLEQSFNSLDAQREACHAYILSQRQEGWRAIDAQYDDGGSNSGRTTTAKLYPGQDHVSALDELGRTAPTPWLPDEDVNEARAIAKELREGRSGIENDRNELRNCKCSHSR